MILKECGVYEQSLYKWLRQYDAFGFDGLKSSKSLGPTPKLNPKQETQLTKLWIR